MRLLQLTTMAALFMAANSALAQVGQLGGGNAAGGAAAGLAGATAPAGGGSTTEGTRGTTTEGVGASSAQDGGVAGGNAAQLFVGGNNAAGFVGGRMNTQNNSNRQFRAITNTNVPTGGNTQSSGTSRRIPFALKIAFSYPAGGPTNLQTVGNTVTMQQVALTRPELRSVAVQFGTDGVATLTGNAPDTATARLAANLVRLRPGVRMVQNQIQVSDQ